MTQDKDKASKKQVHPQTCSTDTELLVSCWCRRSFMSVKGLRIHQTRMKCKQRKEERSEPTSAEEEQYSRSEESELCEASEKCSQDQTYSTADLNVNPQLDERRLKVKWPPMADKKEWVAMDEDISASMSCKGFISTKQKLHWMMTTIYQYGSEKFGVIEKKVQPQETRGQSRHQKQINGIRKELKSSH